MSAGYRGRFAPSPTGPLHFGSLLAALASFVDARHHRGAWLIRIEDVDRPREVAGAADLQLATLAAFGMESDAPVVRQSARETLYAAALARLQAAGHVFPCRCTRSELAASGGIHRHCLRAPSPPAAWRLRVGGERIGFHDRCHGHVEQDLAAEVGDVVLRRADGLWAYQLAVVIDDAEQGITDVVRGADLLDSTPRQILLQRRLGLPTPRYLHVPLIVDAQGRKLSKSAAALPVDAADPMPALHAAWRTLGQTAPIIASTPRDFLHDAARRWNPACIGRTPMPVSSIGGRTQRTGGGV